jgi:hypothetical protein
MLLEGIIEELSDFRRALRGEDKVAFDSLMNKAREHASSCTVVPTLDPMHAIFLSILVEQEKELISLNKFLNNNEGIISTNPDSKSIHPCNCHSQLQ